MLTKLFLTSLAIAAGTTGVLFHTNSHPALNSQPALNSETFLNSQPSLQAQDLEIRTPSTHILITPNRITQQRMVVPQQRSLIPSELMEDMLADSDLCNGQIAVSQQVATSANGRSYSYSTSTSSSSFCSTTLEENSTE